MNKPQKKKEHYIYQDGKEIADNDKEFSSQKTSYTNSSERKKKKARKVIC